MGFAWPSVSKQITRLRKVTIPMSTPYTCTTSSWTWRRQMWLNSSQLVPGMVVSDREVSCTMREKCVQTCVKKIISVIRSLLKWDHLCFHTNDPHKWSPKNHLCSIETFHGIICVETHPETSSHRPLQMSPCKRQRATLSTSRYPKEVHHLRG